jgi:hypothetical protein
MVPSLRAGLADGRAFTAEDLKQGMRTVLLFYLCRW